MSAALEELIAFYVERDSRTEKSSPGDKYHVKKQLEKLIMDEIIFERVDEIDNEVKRRENERAAAREFDEFKKVLFQCVTLALLIGILGSHIYGLLDALFYHVNQDINLLSLIVALVILIFITCLVLFKEYVITLFALIKSIGLIQKR